MRIETLKDFIQSANINFLIGSGLSSPYLETLGEVENILTEIALYKGLEENAKNIISASIYKQYFEKVILPNLIIPSIDTDKGYQYNKALLEYKKFLQLWTLILHKRSNSLISRLVNIYSTNIEIFIERAAEETKIEFNDGFRGSIHPTFDETMFQKRVLKNSVHFQNSSEVPTFNLLKIHGGINWVESKNGTIKNDASLQQIKSIQSTIIKVKEEGVEFIEYNNLNSMIMDYYMIDNPEKIEQTVKPFIEEYNRLVMVNPNKGKFSLTVIDSHFYEMIRMFSNSLEKENSLLIVMGFSFSDEHILNIVNRAARRNPTLQIIIFSYEDNCVEGYENKFRGIPNVTILAPSTLIYEDSQIATKFSLEGINKVFNIINNLIPNSSYGKF